MNVYEYRTLQTDIGQLGQKDFETRLNTIGSDGWKLVATVPHERHGYSHEIHFFFSRAVPSEAQVLNAAE